MVIIRLEVYNRGSTLPSCCRHGDEVDNSSVRRAHNRDWEAWVTRRLQRAREEGILLVGMDTKLIRGNLNQGLAQA